MKYNQDTLKQFECFIDLKRIKGQCTIYYPVSFPYVSMKGDCSVGAFSYMGKEGLLRRASVGNYCSIAGSVLCGPNEHPTDWLSSHSFAFSDNAGFVNSKMYKEVKMPLAKEPKKKRVLKNISIGHDVWIGARALIMSGVTIGNGAIIASHAVVTKDVEPYSVVGGVPAKHIKYRFDKETISYLTRIKWWDYILKRSVIGNTDYSDTLGAAQKIEKLILHNKLPLIKNNIIINSVNKTIIENVPFEKQIC